ncbi:MAG: ribonuclease bn [Verrucomicrobiales bacterium]|nr:ribonuclease bn [Verrucomicrobiales bacterium]
MRRIWTIITTTISVRLAMLRLRFPRTTKVLRRFWTFIDTYIDNWSDDRVPRQSAAIAYYALFSMAPLLLLARLIIGRTLGPAELEGMHARLAAFMGEQAATQLEQLTGDMTLWKGSTPTAVLGAVTLLYGATGVFVELKDSLNMIWGLKRRDGKSAVLFLKDRLLSFGMVLFFGVLLMTSVVTTGIFSVLQDWIQTFLPRIPVEAWVMPAFAIALATETLLFAIIFKVLPDIKFPWRDVWLGALVTALLFEGGKWALGWYLGRASTFAAVGKTGSVVLLLIWVYYSSMIVLAGAEFIEINQRLRGTKHGRKRALTEGQPPPEENPASPLQRNDGLSS